LSKGNPFITQFNCKNPQR